MGEVVAIKITKKLRSQLVNIDDKNCVLLEFVNEEGTLRIGFSAWLAKNTADISKLIESEEQVTTYWPIGCEVQPCRYILKDIRKIKFSENIVIIRSKGEWPVMRKELKSFESVGVLNVSRNSRRKLMNKAKTTAPSGPAAKKTKKAVEIQSQQNKELLQQLKDNKKEDPSVWDDTETSSGTDSDLLNEDDGLSLSKRIEKNRYTKPIGQVENSSSTPLTAGQMPLGNINNPDNNFETDDNSKPVYEQKELNQDAESSFENETGDTNLPPGIKRAFPLRKTILMLIPKRSVQSYVSGLVDNFFEKWYSAEHSPTGQISNAAPTIIPRPALHPPIVKYIRQSVELVFGSTKVVEAKVTKALSDKISGARATIKAQKKARENAQTRN